MSPTILAEPIEMLFGSCTWVGPRNNVLGGGPDSLRGKGNLGVFEPIEKLVIVRSATTAECLYYIQLYSPECTLAENIDINNNKQNKDIYLHSILPKALALSNIQVWFIRCLLDISTGLK